MVALHATPILTEGVERTRSNRLKFRLRHVYPVGIIIMILTPIWLKCYSSFLSKEFYYLTYFVDSLLGYLKPFQGLDDGLKAFYFSSEFRIKQWSTDAISRPSARYSFSEIFRLFWLFDGQFLLFRFSERILIEIIPKFPSFLCALMG